MCVEPEVLAMYSERRHSERGEKVGRQALWKEGNPATLKYGDN